MDVKNIIIGVMAIVIVVLVAKGSGGEPSAPKEPAEQALKQLPEPPDQANRMEDQPQELEGPIQPGQEDSGGADEGGGGPEVELEAEAPEAPEAESEKQEAEKDEEQKEQGAEGSENEGEEQPKAPDEEGGETGQEAGSENGEEAGGENGEEAGEEGNEQSSEEGEENAQEGSEEGGIQGEEVLEEQAQPISGEEEAGGLAEEAELGVSSLGEEGGEEQAQLEVSPPSEEGGEELQPELEVQGEEESEPHSEEHVTEIYGEEEGESLIEEGIPSSSEESIGEEGFQAEISGEEEGFPGESISQEIIGEEAQLQAEESILLEAEEGASFSSEEVSSYLTEEVSPIFSEEASFFAEEGAPFLPEEGSSFLAEEGAPFLSEEGSSFLAEEGAPFLSEEGSSFQAEEGAPFLLEEGSSYLTEEGASIISTEEGASFLPEEGSSYLTEEGASFLPEEGSSYLSEEGVSFSREEISSYLSEEGMIEGTSFLPEEVSSIFAEEGSPFYADEIASFQAEEGYSFKAEEGSTFIADESEFLPSEEGQPFFTEQGSQILENESALELSEESAQDEGQSFYAEEGVAYKEGETENKEESIPFELSTEISEEGIESYYISEISEEGGEPFMSSKYEYQEFESSEEQGIQLESSVESETEFSEEGGVVIEASEPEIFEESNVELEYETSREIQNTEIEFESELISEEFIVSSTIYEIESEYSEEASVLIESEISIEMSEEAGLPVFKEGVPTEDYESEKEAETIYEEQDIEYAYQTVSEIKSESSEELWSAVLEYDESEITFEEGSAPYIKSEVEQESKIEFEESENSSELSYEFVESEIESSEYESEEEEEQPKLLSQWSSEDDENPQNVSYDQDELFADFETQVETANEYAAGVWVRWQRAYPKLLPFQSSLHSIFRMTSIQQHHDEQDLGDRLLAAFVGQGYFQFSTSCKEKDAFLNMNIPYDDNLEGQWNFVYFGYKRHYTHPSGRAAAWVYSTETQGEIIKANHDFLHGYVHFIMGKEFNYPFFNGNLAKANFQIGAGSYLGEESAFNLIVSEMMLPSTFQFESHRISQRINDERIKSTSDEASFDPIRPEVVAGAFEYAVSGWARLSEQDVAWMLVFRLAQQNDELTDSEIAGDRTLYISRNGEYYYMQTYSCEQSECQVKISQEVENSLFGKHWTWFYFGYRKGEAFAHMENNIVERDFIFDGINHFTLMNWVLYLQKDPYHAGFNGQFFQWQLNIGQGSFRTSAWDEAETPNINYAYETELMELLKGYEHPEPINVSYDDTSTSLVIELMDTDDITLDATTEYGIGFWSRFLYNGPSKLIEKPKWMGLMSLDSVPDNDPSGCQLSVVLTEGQYVFSSYLDQIAIDYGVKLDGEWVYIQFAYSLEHKSALGYVWWSEEDIQKAFFDDVNHPALSTYLKVSVGSFSPSLVGFNGQIEKIQISLGRDAFFPDEEDLTKFIKFDLPVFLPQKFEEKEIFQETRRFTRESEPEPDEIATFEVTEYSIGVWFRTTEAPSIPLQVVYAFVSNQPEYLSNIAKPGDRTLGLYVDRFQKVYFSTYTLLEQDGFEYIPHQCEIEMEDHYSWMYAYFGYTKNEAYAYLLHGNNECVGTMNVIHQVPDYLGLYVGVDPFHSGFYGKMAYFYIELGVGSYTNNLIQEKKSYNFGISEFYPEDNIHKTFYDLTLNSVGDTITYEWEDGDTAETNIDGISEYSITFWYKYLFTYPIRVYELPIWSQLIRFSSSESQTDSDQPGDRTLAIFIRDIAYHFSTYSIHEDNHAPVTKDIENLELDGIWTKISFSFSQKLMQAQAYVEIDGEIKEEILEKILHYPLDQHCWLHVGQQFMYPGANGLMSQLLVALGKGSYVSSDELFQQLLFAPLIEQQLPNQFDIITTDEEISEDTEINPFEFRCQDDYKQEYDQYSLSGWYKWNRDSNKPSDCHLIFRLTTTEPQYLDDNIDQGDRTMAGHYCFDNYIFSTYNFKDPNIHSIQIPVNEYYAQWTYFYFGYDRQEHTIQLYLAYPNIGVSSQLDNIQHLVPNYIALYAGMDGIDNQFIGTVKYWQFNLGPGSYAKPHHQNIIEVLPYYFNHKVEPQFTYEINDNDSKTIISPNDDDSDAYIISFGPEIEGTYVYSIGVWTRWLEYYPSQIEQRRNYHSVFRMASTEIYQDVASLGDRILTVLVSKGEYLFSTYDTVHDIANANKEIPYDNEFEGHWNYIYFGYKFDASVPMAIGYVYFTASERSEQVEFYSLKHNIMGPYAIVKFGAKEFQYQPFHGQFYDPKISFGIENAFLSDTDQLQQYIDAIALEPAPDSDASIEYTFLEEEITYSLEDDTVEYIREAFTDIGFMKEYAVCGWAQVNDIDFDENMEMIVFRLSNSAMDIIDDGNFGDRTFLVALEGSGIEFSTYSYTKESSDGLFTNEIVEYNGLEKEWIFYYFGYSFNQKQASLFLRYSDGTEHSQVLENINHYVAHDLYIQLGKDGIYTPYDGTMFGWTLHLGQNAFSTEPTDFISSYPSSQTPSFITLSKQRKKINQKKEKLFLVAQS